MRKWKCVDIGDKDEWTVGKIYKTGNDGNGLVSDIGSIGWVQPLREDTGAKFEEVKQFTKADLKPCMMVEIRDGRLLEVKITKEGFILYNNYHKIISQKYINEDLMSADSKYDFMKVYDIPSNNDSSFSDINNRELLWERIEKSPKELKIEQLQLKLDEIKSEMEQLKGE